VINRSFLKKVIKVTRTGLCAVFAGSSFLLQDVLDLGGAGVICPLPLIAAKDCLELYQAMQGGKLDLARRLQSELLEAAPLFAGIDVPPLVAAWLPNVVFGMAGVISLWRLRG
jgi:dihydrodipicolinate synthase/N-acetylneuraminate lyase